VKRRWKLLLAGVALLVLLVIFLSPGGPELEPPRVLRLLFDLLPHNTTYAYFDVDLECTLFIHDAATGEPITGAEFTVWTPKHTGDDGGEPTIMVADKTGRAKIARMKVSCEEVVRSFRKSVIRLDANRCEFSLRAEGYQAIEHVSLHGYPYLDKGYSRKEELHRAEYKIPLWKQN
jgi:hypothetical protein